MPAKKVAVTKVTVTKKKINTLVKKAQKVGVKKPQVIKPIFVAPQPKPVSQAPVATPPAETKSEAFERLFDPDEVTEVEAYMRRAKKSAPFDPAGWAVMGKKFNRIMIVDTSIQDDGYVSVSDTGLDGGFEAETIFDLSYNFYINRSGKWEELDNWELESNGFPRYDTYTGQPAKIASIVEVWCSKLVPEDVEDKLKEKGLAGTTQFKEIPDNFLNILDVKNKETQKKVEDIKYIRKDESYLIAIDPITAEMFPPDTVDEIHKEICGNLYRSNPRLPSNFEYRMF
jgi:hypothetical protein